ncbi:hypothetical protein P692DRAFT_20871090 [Suillus brevipes Sb2]|nr:hypothetical protein P692DRAFT_20871090 [Suillus brevipes Sb2]
MSFCARRLAQANVEGLSNLSNSLKTFNESFVSWLYVMDMNGLTVDWPQAPTNTLSSWLGNKQVHCELIHYAFKIDATYLLEENTYLAEEAALKAAVPPPSDSEADKTTFAETQEFK